jgi:hypothetical protein
MDGSGTQLASAWPTQHSSGMQNMSIQLRTGILALFALAALAPSKSTPQDAGANWPRTREPHWALFCGVNGGDEIPKAYSLALLREIQRLEGAGFSGQALWRQLRAQAACDVALRTPRAANRR